MGEGVPIYWRLGEKTAAAQSLLRASEPVTYSRHKVIGRDSLASGDK
jgi:hypothetical protein